MKRSSSLLNDRVDKIILKSFTFTGAAGKGAVGTANLFTVTGSVKCTVYGICTSDLTEAAPTATISVGITGSTAAFIAVTNAVDIDTTEVWLDNTPARSESLPTRLVLAQNSSIFATIAAQNVTGGTINFYCEYIPLSSGAKVVAA